MSIKYNNKVVAGKYKEQIIPFANTIDAGIAKIATQEEINEGIDNTSIVTPVYLAQKQDKLIAGDGININEANIISSKITPDKVTIVENENNTISTVARKTVNESIIYDWEGTEAEYHQALMNGEINPDWYCYITDDELSVSYNDVLSRTLINIAPDGEEVIKDLSEKNLSKKITNCITEIPQRIKLELTDGVLTLKAGSKVIMPNGVNKFDEVVINSDISTSYGFSSSQDKLFVFLNTANNTIFYQSEAALCSGATDTITNKDHYWYDTTNNLFKRINSANEDTGQRFYLPFAICAANATDKWTAIKQVFNSVGYIGSTLFINKDIKYLVPNGRNNDGTLNNIEYTSSIKTTVSGNNAYTMTLNHVGGFGRILKDSIYIQETAPTNLVNNTTNWFKPSENQWYRYINNVWTKVHICPIGDFTGNSSLNVTYFNPKEAFRAVDYNDYKNDLYTLNNTLNNITNTLDNTKVNKSGDTMTGNLKIQGGSTQHVVQCISNLLMSENPTAASGVGKFQVLDKEGNYLMQAGCERDTDGRNSAFIRAHSPEDWSKSATIQVTYLRDGTYGCNFPKCTTKATTTSSARSDLVAVVVQNYVNGTSWYRVWSDGWIEQGGFYSVSNGNALGGATVTMLKSFSNTSYTVVGVSRAASNQADNNFVNQAHILPSAVNQIKFRGQCGAGVNWYACGY